MRSGLLRPSVLLVLVAVAGSCSSSQDDGPRPAGVVPNAGYVNVPTAVEISGTRFLAKATQPSGGGTPQVDTRTRAWLGDAELPDVTWVSEERLTATVPAGLSVGVHRLTVENALGQRGTLDGAFTALAAPSFSATVSAAPTTVSVGQTFTVTLALANAGGTDLNALTLGEPVLTPPGLASLQPGGGPTPPAAPLAPGTIQSFTWTYVATALGTLALTFGPTTGTDALLGQALTATPPAAVQVSVQRPAALQAALSIPPSLAIQSEFPVTMTVTNTGGASAIAVIPGDPAVVGTPGTAVPKAGAGPTPTTAVIPGGQAAVFTWTYTAAAVGSFRLSGTASGKDANSGGTVTAAPATSNTAVISNAAIVATISSAPANVRVGQTFLVAVNFSNPGTSDITFFVAQSTPAAASGPVPSVPTLGAGTNRDLTWGFNATSAGRLDIVFTASGRDDLTGLSVTGSTTATIEVVP